MPPYEKKLHKPQEAPQAPGGFAGRPALISSLLLPHCAERGRGEEIALASIIVKETMKQLIAAARADDGFEAHVRALAERILAAREEGRLRQIGPSRMEIPRPASLPEALSGALRKMGVEARIAGEMRGNGISIFTLVEGGSENKVPLRDSILASDDPIAEAEKVARMLAVGRSNGDARDGMLKARRATRPPAAPLGIEEADLDLRKTTYDGSIGNGGKILFTYLVEGMETTFTAPSGLRGKELLEFIDAWIFSMHIAYRKPLDAQVCEAISSGGVRDSARDADGDPIAQTLRRLARDPLVEGWLVPWEYRDAFMELRASAAYSGRASLLEAGALTDEEAAAFSRALSMLGEEEGLCGRALEEVRGAYALACGFSPPAAGAKDDLGGMLEGIASAAKLLRELLATRGAGI